jgi:hypothetical protein
MVTIVLLKVAWTCAWPCERVRLLFRAEARLGLDLARSEGAKLVDYLREKYNLVVRTVGNKDAGTLGVRVSTPIYISTKEVDMVIEGVRTLLAHKA